MKTYTIETARRAALVRALILRLAVIFGAILLVAMAIAAFFVTRFAMQNSQVNVVVMALAVVVLAVIIGLRLAQQVRDYDHGLESLRIDLHDERVSKKQAGYKDVNIARNEVTTLIETTDGVLIMTRDKARFLWMPAQLDGYAEARSRLGKWMDIRQLPARSQQSQKLLTLAWALATALCVGAMLFSVEPWQVVISAVAVLAIYIYVYRLLSKQRGVDLRFRRTYSSVLLFLIIVVAIKLIMTLSPLISR